MSGAKDSKMMSCDCCFFVNIHVLFTQLDSIISLNVKISYTCVCICLFKSLGLKETLHN